MKRTPRTSLLAVTTAAAACAATALLVPSTASAAPNNNSSAKLQQAVTNEGVLKHLRAFQDIANRNGGNRAAGTPGYDASARYVHDQLKAAGYAVAYQEFKFPFFEETATSRFERVSPTPRTFSTSTTPPEFTTSTYSGSGDVTAAVVPVDVKVPPTAVANGSTSGCEASDFAGFPAGSIALLQRGTCPFGVKALNAQQAGAAAVILFNEGQAGRQETLNATLGAPAVTIPVLGISYELGAEFVRTASRARVVTSTISEERTTRNVIANSTTGRTDNVVMSGAHLDSVTEGPGINDNGSGSAAILETALQFAKTKPGNQVRFAFWSAEELGLLGSAHYVASLTDAQRKQIALYLNFDMVGSPNYMRGVYDGDGSSFNLTGPPGSAQIESLFNQHFSAKNLPFQGTEFSGRSDYQAFINNDIPAGGLFTGAEGVKTPAEAQKYGGVAGAAYDPCYHSACDTLDDTGKDLALYNRFPNRLGNISLVALETNSDAIAHAVATYAYDTAAINGVRGPGKSHGQAKGTPGRHDDASK